MSEITLYRKYRPSTFDDVVGQDHIVGAIKGMLAQGAIAHAYLMNGTRGTGKTSIARIIAAELETSQNDLYEIDAASNRGIDDIRELRESVQTLPFDSKYKVYIIDEVHMLTKEAFNALLKTLEEPPSYVIFILATTEMEKIPDTIISRCQTYTFKKPTLKTLQELVKKVSEKEGFAIATPALHLIAMLGDGSFRDTLGMLQKVIGASAEKKIELAEVEKIAGAPPQLFVYDMVRAIANGNVDAALSLVAKAGEANISMKIYLTLILTTLRQIMLLTFAPSMKKDIEEQLDENGVALMAEVVQIKPSRMRSGTLLRLLEASTQIDSAHIQSLPLELALVDILGDSSDNS